MAHSLGTVMAYEACGMRPAGFSTTGCSPRRGHERLLLSVARHWPCFGGTERMQTDPAWHDRHRF